MNHLLNGLKGRVKKSLSSMRMRLIISFAVPVMLLMLLALLGTHGILLAKTQSQTLNNALSRYDQSYELIESYVNAMTFVSNNIYFNGDLQRIVGDPGYTDDMPISERYREYLVLNEVFEAAEKADVIYRAGIFLPEEIPYTNHRMHFMPMSDLTSRADYSRYEETLQRGRSYFYSAPVEVPGDSSRDTETVVTLLRPINTTDRTTRQICVAQVCVKVDAFADLLTLVKSTDHSLVYLTGESQELIASTDAERYRQLEAENLLPDEDTDRDWSKMKIDGEAYYVMCRDLPESRWSMVCLIPESDIRAEGRFISLLILLLTVLIFAAIVSVAVLLSGSYTRRLQKLNQMIQRVRSGELKQSRSGDPDQDEITELVSNFNEMTAELKKLMAQQYRSGKAVKAAELRALQAQINPHFLYNTLDLINWEAFEHDAPEISEIAQNLAKFYRISLNKGRQILTIDEELQHVQAYVRIENCHFDDKIHLEIDVPEEIRSLACINIILQPFVENAILHGFAEDSARSGCNIRISAAREGEDLYICIADDGPGMTEEQVAEIMQENSVHHSSGYGVKNIHSRLQLSFGEAYGVSFLHDGTPGTKVCLRLPVLQPEEAERRVERS